MLNNTFKCKNPCRSQTAIVNRNTTNGFRTGRKQAREEKALEDKKEERRRPSRAWHSRVGAVCLGKVRGVGEATEFFLHRLGQD